MRNTLNTLKYLLKFIYPKKVLLDNLILKAFIFLLKKLGYRVNDWNTKYIIITKKVGE